jgi:hypothetical protein
MARSCTKMPCSPEINSLNASIIPTPLNHQDTSHARIKGKSCPPLAQSRSAASTEQVGITNPPTHDESHYSAARCRGLFHHEGEEEGCGFGIRDVDLDLDLAPQRQRKLPCATLAPGQYRTWRLGFWRAEGLGKWRERERGEGRERVEVRGSAASGAFTVLQIGRGRR